MLNLTMARYPIAKMFDISTREYTSSYIILAFLGTLFICPLLTWSLTTYQECPVSPGMGKEPPVVSYWLPWFQHLFPFLIVPDRLFKALGKKYPRVPFTLIMMNTKFHIFSSAEAVSNVFSKSREFVFPPVVASMMENALMLPLEDSQFFNTPEKSHAESAAGEGIDSQDFVKQNHTVYLKYLSNQRLDEIMAVYLNNFFLELDKVIKVDSLGEEWTEIALHETMSRVVFETSTTTFFGLRIRELWGKSMWSDFQEWNDASYFGVRANFAYYFQPKAFFARKRMLKAFEKWVDCDIEDWDENEGVWNEKWGCKVNWEREQLARQYGFTHRGRACSQASFLFVTNTNATPLATWLILCLIQSVERLREFREAIQPLILPQSNLNPEDLRFDMAKLKAHPYVRGVWNEALRLGSVNAAARVVSKDTELQGYALKRGSVILLPVRLLHFDEDVFPDPEKFIPERWNYDLSPDATEEERRTMAQKQKKQSANLRTFGGGTGLCSGRFVAEQEMLSTVSTMLMLFDMELIDHESCELNPRCLGIMSPLREPRVRMRKRKNPRVL